jgi:hypothetical protein
MALNYTQITIAGSNNSRGNTYNDPYRCNYSVQSESGDTYLAFQKKGASLRNLPIGTRLKIGWKFNTNKNGKQEKIIQWFDILSTPQVLQYHCPIGYLPTQDIDTEYAKILHIMGK